MTCINLRQQQGGVETWVDLREERRTVALNRERVGQPTRVHERPRMIRHFIWNVLGTAERAMSAVWGPRAPADKRA